MDELNDWVLTMQEDYSAGVNQLIADGIADPERVCIYGEGEEAYTALMSTVLSADLFECAISRSADRSEAAPELGAFRQRVVAAFL